MNSQTAAQALRDSDGGRAFVFVCTACNVEFSEFAYECGQCAGAVVLAASALERFSTDETAAGIWRYDALLPASTSRVTLGEGDTPLLPIKDEMTAMRVPVYAKLESLNPTLSFKDRAMAIGASLAVDRGFRGLVVASTGNAAASASAYAAAAGLECKVLVGTESNAARKLDTCRAYGASVVEIEGNYSDAYAAAKEAENGAWMNVSTTYRNPFLAEAYRSIAFELLAQLDEAPQTVVIPIGAGPLLRGLERGFQDALELGEIQRMPRLVGVQASRVSPIMRRWMERTGQQVAGVTDSGPTVATAIADPLFGYESHGQITIEAVERSRGGVVAVTEAQIVASTRALAAAGIWVEPSAATGLAALEQLDDSFGVPDAGSVVIILTGHGVKSPIVSSE